MNVREPKYPDLYDLGNRFINVIDVDTEVYKTIENLEKEGAALSILDKITYRNFLHAKKAEIIHEIARMWANGLPFQEIKLEANNLLKKLELSSIEFRTNCQKSHHINKEVLSEFSGIDAQIVKVNEFNSALSFILRLFQLVSPP